MCCLFDLHLAGTCADLHRPFSRQGREEVIWLCPSPGEGPDSLIPPNVSKLTNLWPSPPGLGPDCLMAPRESPSKKSSAMAAEAIAFKGLASVATKPPLPNSAATRIKPIKVFPTLLIITTRPRTKTREREGGN